MVNLVIGKWGSRVIAVINYQSHYPINQLLDY
jgi:hypothetical protein